jgi:hypothetical protein
MYPVGDGQDLIPFFHGFHVSHVYPKVPECVSRGVRLTQWLCGWFWDSHPEADEVRAVRKHPVRIATPPAVGAVC